jgi:cytochrome c biogenesis protein CcmG, thiol:disulfide interchange protein DsbE
MICFSPLGKSGRSLRRPKSEAAKLVVGATEVVSLPNPASARIMTQTQRLCAFRSLLDVKPASVVALVLLALTGCYSGSRPPRIGTAAPDFTVRDSDRTVTLSQFKGQVVVLNFWATWCPPCIEEMPSLVEMQQRMKAKGVTVIAVSLDVDASNYHRFLRDHGVNLLSVRDGEGRSNALYGTFKFPETYVIDRNGIMRRKFIGAVDWTGPDVIEYLGKL